MHTENHPKDEGARAQELGSSGRWGGWAISRDVSCGLEPGQPPSCVAFSCSGVRVRVCVCDGYEYSQAASLCLCYCFSVLRVELWASLCQGGSLPQGYIPSLSSGRKEVLKKERNKSLLDVPVVAVPQVL